MTNRADQIGTRQWVEENNRRVIFQNHMYKCAGRDNPEHSKHGLFTGLWEDFCLNEAGIAQRDQWFERMQFVQDVKDGKIKMPVATGTGFIPDDDYPPRAEEEIAYDFNISNASDPIDDYFNCSAECAIDDQECEDICLDDLKKPVIEEFDNFSVTQADSPHQAAIASSS